MHARPEDKGEAEDGDERAAQRALGQAVLHLGEEVERAHRRDQAATARAPVGGDGNCRQRTRSRGSLRGGTPPTRSMRVQYIIVTYVLYHPAEPNFVRRRRLRYRWSPMGCAGSKEVPVQVPAPSDTPAAEAAPPPPGRQKSAMKSSSSSGVKKEPKEAAPKVGFIGEEEEKARRTKKDELPVDEDQVDLELERADGLRTGSSGQQYQISRTAEAKLKLL